MSDFGAKNRRDPVGVLFQSRRWKTQVRNYAYASYRGTVRGIVEDRDGRDLVEVAAEICVWCYVPGEAFRPDEQNVLYVVSGVLLRNILPALGFYPYTPRVSLVRLTDQ